MEAAVLRNTILYPGFHIKIGNHLQVYTVSQEDHIKPPLPESHKITSKTFVTYLLTPLSGVLLEKLTGSQLVKKFLTVYGT